MRLTLLLLWTFPWAVSTAWALPIPGDNLPESGEAICLNHKTQQQRSVLSYALEISTEDDKLVYHLTTRGQGDFDIYQNVTWLIESTIEAKKGILRPVQTLCRVKDAGGNPVATWRHNYDYQSKKLVITLTDEILRKTRNYTFPIKGRTADYATLNVFVKSFIPHLGEREFASFYLITSEPKMYKVNIKPVEKEILDLPSGTFPALKLRLIADMGILDEVFDKIVPPTFLWYEDTPPHRWLKYEGMETGLGSTYIEGYLVSPGPGQN